MAHADNFETRLFDAMIATAKTIAAATDYVTAPEVYDGGVPLNAIETVTAPRLYLTHVATVPNATYMTTDRYGWTASFAWFIVARDPRTVLQTYGDLKRAFNRARGAYAAAPAAGGFGQPVYLKDFNSRDDLRTAFYSVGTLLVTLDYDTDTNEA